MLKQFVSAILFSIVMIGCGERYGGPIFPVPHIPDERPTVPSENEIVADINEAIGGNVDTEIVDEIFSVESRIYIVIVENGTDTPTFYKVTYYLLDGEWVCIPEAIKM